MATFNVPVMKGGPNATVEVDTDKLDPDTYAFVIAEGLKALANTRMAKVGAITKLEGAELDKAHASAMTIAADNIQRLYSGKLTAKASGKSKATAKGTDRALTAEARRIAKDMVRNLLRAAGKKPSQYTAKDLTAAADQLIASDATILDTARANLATTAEATGSAAQAIDISTILKPDPKLVAKAETAAAKRKADKANAPLSAKQAGLTAGRKPPVARPRPDAVMH